MEDRELGMQLKGIRMKAGLRGMVSRGIIFFLCCGVLATVGCETKKEVVAPPPPVVEVVKVTARDVPIYKEWVAILDGNINAVIKPQVSGYLIKQNYTEGQFVKKGHILFEIDPRTFQAALNEARGSLDKAKGDLARAEAAFVTAKADLARIKPLAAKNAVSQKDLDDAIGKDLTTRASVEASKAAVVAAAANVESADLNLSFTKITSPVDGIAGIAKTQLGNLVSPNSQQELTTVSSVNPIKAYINVSEREYLGVRGDGKDVENVPLELILTDGSVYPEKGKFALADRQIDPTTGTIKVGTLFPNPQNLLRPGGFGMVRAVMSVQKDAVLILQRAVSDIQGKYMVAVVGSDNKAEIRQVKVGPRIGSEWIISEGLKAGETVVVEGIQKARPGSTVTPKPFTPDASGKKDTEAKPAASTNGKG
jgi:membrane fusion protein (multidrug efflux system)